MERLGTMTATAAFALVLGLATTAGCSSGSTGSDGTTDESSLQADVNSASMLLPGALLFFSSNPQLHGNGRACGTCHRLENQLALTPATVEARYQALQSARLLNPSADDPLFRSIDADDGANDYTTLRTRGLIRVRMPLPPNVHLIDDPTATSVVVLRAVPTVINASLTAPYQLDGREQTLESQALGAFHAHAQVTLDPSASALTAIGDFEKSLYSSFAVRKMALAVLAGDTSPPDPDPPLTALQAQGKALFANFCGGCHGGPSMTHINEPRAFPPFDGTHQRASISVLVSAPSPPGFGLPASNGLPIHTYAVTINTPNGPTTIVRPSDDPGRVLLTGDPNDFNAFDVPTLRGISKTAPYFHNNTANTLEDVVRHYQGVFKFVAEGLKFPFPELPDEDVTPIVEYLKVL